MQQAVYLVSKGFTQEIAFSMQEEKRIAFFIIAQQFESGKKFNFNSMQFDK